jgi:hypothetical protein
MNVLSRDQIIERALRRIGEFSINNRAPRERAINEAAYWLDMLMGHETARMRMWWMVDETKTFALTEDVYEYDLTDAIGEGNLPRGLQFIIGAYLYNSETGKQIRQLDLWRREDWERPTDRTTAGEPCAIYVNRDYKPSAFISPPPNDTVPYEVHIVGQSYSSNFVSAQPTSKTMKLRSSWNLWIVQALSAEIGAGPVRKLPADEIREMREYAKKLRDEIEAADTDEHMGDPGRVAYYNGI